MTCLHTVLRALVMNFEGLARSNNKATLIRLNNLLILQLIAKVNGQTLLSYCEIKGVSRSFC